MERFSLQDIHVTPSAEELLPNYLIKCDYDDCTSTFTNNGSYLMHKQRHHKLLVNLERMDTKLYHCPDEKCKYNYALKRGEGFKDLRYLRQHYQKVHMQKSFSCSSCEKSFITLSKLESHNCGEKFICEVCYWQYDSREGLLTHAKRKNHEYLEVKANKRAKASPEPIIDYSESTNDSDILKEYMDKETQTKGKRLRTVCVQTEAPEGNLESNEDLCNVSLPDSLDMLLKSIETQTEYRYESTATMTCDPTMFHQELGHNASTNMCTQTCDNILRELGLCDIETQTYWPQAKTTQPKTTKYSLDELLVSTETQTSFTQCLLDSCTSTTDCSTNTVSNEANSLNNFYTTQYTQTSDRLYSDLFDDEEEDFGTFETFPET